MVSPATFIIGVIVCTAAWCIALMDNDLTQYRRQQFIISLVMGWGTMLLLEGFGLFGPYAGPEPHM